MNFCPFSEPQMDEESDNEDDVVSRSGQILWIRGLTRLQTQVRIFKKIRLSTNRFIKTQGYQII